MSESMTKPLREEDEDEDGTRQRSPAVEPGGKFVIHAVTIPSAAQQKTSLELCSMKNPIVAVGVAEHGNDVWELGQLWEQGMSSAPAADVLQNLLLLP